MGLRSGQRKRSPWSVDWLVNLEHNPKVVSRSVALFGVYLAAVGLIVLLIPNVLLTTMGLPNTDEPWIRVLGLVVLALGVYYIVSREDDATAFVRASVPIRLLAAAGLMVIAALSGYWQLMLFALPDAGGAMWTRWALRRQPEATLSP